MLSFAGLCLLVGFVGAVGVVARTVGTWPWLFRFEQIAAASVPLALALLAASLVGAVGVVALSPTTTE